MSAPLGAERLPDWEARLAGVVSRHLHAPFVWGASDCLRFVGACVEAVVGHDPWADLQGYSGPRGAARIAKAYGARSVSSALADALWGAPVGACRSGDIGVVKIAGRSSCAVMFGQDWLCRTRDGLRPVPAGQVCEGYVVGWHP
jgi:hypothetical protein